MASEQGKRHRWQFHLSTMLLLTAVVALAIGWWVERTRLHQELIDARKRIQFLETSRYFDGNLMSPRDGARLP